MEGGLKWSSGGSFAADEDHHSLTEVRGARRNRWSSWGSATSEWGLKFRSGSN